MATPGNLSIRERSYGRRVPDISQVKIEVEIFRAWRGSWGQTFRAVAG